MSEHWDQLINRAIAFRRELHRIPELTWEEKQTAQRIRGMLDDAGIVWKPCANTGTIATLAPQAKGRHIALRGDIDALPIHEDTKIKWKSQIPGRMHACGHDGHTATLMATALWLNAHEEKLPGPVTLLFQPAEEGGHGAREMIKEGALNGVDVIYGWHNWPAICLGKAVCPDGPVMAANGTFRLTVKGKGGHASQPQSCRDPVLAVSSIVVNLQQIVRDRRRPENPAVLSVTYIDAPSGETTFPDRAVAGGTLRCSGTRERDQMNEMIRDIARDTAAGHGVEVDVEFQPRYGPTVNHADAAKVWRAALEDALGQDWQDKAITVPLMASEDFSYYLEAIPGAFALIGSADGEPEHEVPCHSAHYDFNDKLIPMVVRLLTRLAGGPEPP